MCVYGLAIPDPKDPDALNTVCLCDEGWTGAACNINCQARCNFRGTACASTEAAAEAAAAAALLEGAGEAPPAPLAWIGAPAEECVCGEGFSGTFCEATVVTQLDGSESTVIVGASEFLLAAQQLGFGVVNEDDLTPPGTVTLSADEEGCTDVVARRRRRRRAEEEAGSGDGEEAPVELDSACMSCLVDVDFPSLVEVDPDVAGTEAESGSARRRRLAMSTVNASWSDGEVEERVGMAAPASRGWMGAVMDTIHVVLWGQPAVPQEEEQVATAESFSVPRRDPGEPAWRHEQRVARRAQYNLRRTAAKPRQGMTRRLAEAQGTPVRVSLVVPPEARGPQWHVSLVPWTAPGEEPATVTDALAYSVTAEDAAACNSDGTYDPETGRLEATVCFAGRYRLAIVPASSVPPPPDSSAVSMMAGSGALSWVMSAAVAVLLVCASWWQGGVVV